MNSYDDCKAIVELDLDPIKVKLMHKESGEGWSLQRANAVESEYRRFLYLAKTFPTEDVSPTVDVDTFWHYHILDTMKYAKDCEVVFGYFLHHFPYVGLRGDDDLRTREELEVRSRTLYEQAFSTTASKDGSNDAAWCSVTAKAAWCSVTGKQAWCSVTGKQAWCSVTGKQAWCSVTAKQAWCSVAAKQAWCSVTAKQAWCSVTAKQAWCSVAAKPAWCSVNGKAWCSVTGEAKVSSVRPSLKRELVAA